MTAGNVKRTIGASGFFHVQDDTDDAGDFSRETPCLLLIRRQPASPGPVPLAAGVRRRYTAASTSSYPEVVHASFPLGCPACQPGGRTRQRGGWPNPEGPRRLAGVRP